MKKIQRVSYKPLSVSMTEQQFRKDKKLQLPQGYSSVLSNPQVLSKRLPSLDFLRKPIQIVSQRNTKFKLSTIEQKLNEMAIHLHNIRLQAKDTRHNVYLMKESLVNTTLKKNQEDLRDQISNLQQLVTVTKSSHESRSNDLRESYINLWNQTEQLKHSLFCLTQRIDKIDYSMGYNLR